MKDKAEIVTANWTVNVNLELAGVTHSCEVRGNDFDTQEPVGNLLVSDVAKALRAILNGAHLEAEELK